MSFDLVSHPIENIVRYLETNFNDYFELAIIDFNNSVDLKKNNSFYLLKLPKPIKTFNTDWNTTKYRNSELGVYVEKCICDFIKEILDKDFNNNSNVCASNDPQNQHTGLIPG